MCSGAALTLDRDDLVRVVDRYVSGGRRFAVPYLLSPLPAWAFIGRLLASFCGVEQSGSSLGS